MSDNLQKVKPVKGPEFEHHDDVDSNESGWRALLRSSWTKSIGLHGLILLSLLVSFNFSAKPLVFASDQMAMPNLPQSDIVQATFIDSNVIEQNKREKAQAEAAAAQRKRQQQEAAEKERARKKKIEEDRKRKEQQERDRKNKLEEEQRKEREIQAKREQERKEREEQEKRQKELQREMEEQLKQEQQTLSAANQRRIMSEVDKYRALVYSKVKRNLDTDGGFIGEYCSVNVRLAPDGLVLLAKAQSGNAALCRIAESAVLRSGTLPVSDDPEVMAQFRNFTIEVRPEK